MASSVLISPVLVDPTKANDGSAAAPSFAFNNSTNMGLYRVDNTRLGISVSGSNCLTVKGVPAQSPKVGIGVENPSVSLDISAGAAIAAVRLGDAAHALHLKSANPGVAAKVGTETGHDLSLVVAGTNRVTLSQNGGTHVNATGPVADNGEALGVQGQSSTQIIAGFKTGSSTDLGFVLFKNLAGTSVGSIFLSSSSTAYLTTSDYRLKEEIQPLASALSRIEKLKPCTYKWKAGGAIAEGFIAHELAEVCAAAVYGDKDAVNEDGSIRPQGVDQSKLIALLTAGIQELSAQNKKLEERLQMLEAKHGS